MRLPDATSSLVFCGDARGVKVVAVGPIRRAFYKSSASLGHYTRITFHPGMARLALGVSPREIVDRTADLASLWGSAARPLFDTLVHDPMHTSRFIEIISTLLARRCEGASSWRSELVRRGARALANDGEGPRVRVIAEHLGVSERYLRNAFRDELGLSPKQFARIARIRRVAESAASGSLPWATLATTYGFFDQSHLNAEFRDLLRSTPKAFRAGDVSPSSDCGATLNG